MSFRISAAPRTAYSRDRVQAPRPNPPCASPLTYAVGTTNSGQHQFAVRALDAAGNVSTTASDSWKVIKNSGQQYTITGIVTSLLYPTSALTGTPIDVTFDNPNAGNGGSGVNGVQVSNLDGDDRFRYGAQHHRRQTLLGREWRRFRHYAVQRHLFDIPQERAACPPWFRRSRLATGPRSADQPAGFQPGRLQGRNCPLLVRGDAQLGGRST